METSTLRKQMPVSALFDTKIIVPAIGSAFVKLDPRTLIKNPVMFVLEIVTILTTVFLIRDLVTGGGNLGFTFQIILWLWLTVLFANFSEAVAEGRGKAQADSLRRQRTETQAKLLQAANSKRLQACPRHQPEGRRHRAGRGRRLHPLRRRGDRGHRLGQRGRHHRRVGPCHPRVRRRPLGGHRRHAGAVRLDPRAHHVRGRLHLPRSHDPAGGGRRAAEDAQRDRAQHPARRARPSSSCSPRRPSRATSPMRAARSPSSCWSRCSSR